MRLQKTIGSEARLSGKGLFASQDAKVVFRPAEIDTGVVFVRSDLAEPVRIPALIANVAQRDRRSALKKGSVSIETPEHCLAALSALQIDNIIVEVDGPELPGFFWNFEKIFENIVTFWAVSRLYK